jgi:hypothetical protein
MCKVCSNLSAVYSMASLLHTAVHGQFAAAEYKQVPTASYYSFIDCEVYFLYH